MTPELDTTVPHSARVWNHLLGGKDNYEADQRAAEQFRAVFPQIVDIALADRAFLGRSVRYLAGEAGVRQFLDIGTGLPTMDNTHEVAQRTAPDSRIVYVDNDPLVLVHARALLTGTPEGACDYIHADLRDPGEILEKAAATLDLARPVAIMLLGVVHFVQDDGEARRLLARLLDAVPSGSHLVITHATLDFDEGRTAQAQAQADWNEKSANPMVPRTREQFTRFFDGLELLPPGVVSMSRWRPEHTPWGSPDEVAGYAAVARKP
ncbi:SAM-dependent methyltransferase [Actinomadura xylanilytica]|uniref:SAM-dependent methyltransferase n=1 Tax=Actinomadura xylanilytica TaxID=887459 RepID=UPI00255AC824|nr:SAM-dependent methyltransferase [Actinomadura xylanilytica]MDL4775313.1 SAM-dependent methyltransferase [Actinomadura xylanilytica]